MLRSIIRAFGSLLLAPARSATITFRPQLWEMEGRITPANTVWIGNGVGNGALWSVAANWNNGVPGANDVAIFDACGRG